MAVNQLYIVNAFDLKVGKRKLHEFEVDKLLLEVFESDIALDLNAKAKVELLKSNTLIDCSIVVDGVITLVCDRSLRDYQHQLSFEHKMFFKFSEVLEEESADDDLVFVEYGVRQLDFTHIIYDLIAVQLPMKKLHPDEEEIFEEDTTDIEISDGGISEEKSGDKTVDPRWEALKALQNKKG